jgi:hypothetical protein
MTGALQLGNQGDALTLTDPTDAPIDQVSYKANQVKQGHTIAFGR